MSKTYSTRSSARRAAKKACKKALGPWFQALEGPDFAIHPQPASLDDMIAGRYLDRYRFELRGPAKEGK